MKLFIASDIHGSSFYLKQMLDMYQKEKADKLIILGDILYHGPRNDLPEGYNPKEVIELLNERAKDIIAVEGNCDSFVDSMVLKFPIIPCFSGIFCDNHYIFATHGHVYNKDNIPPLSNGNIVLFGHTHVPEFTKIDNIIFANPGSVSIPKDNSEHGYMIIQNNEMIWKNLKGEILDKKSII